MTRPADAHQAVACSGDPLDLAAASRDLWPGGTLDMWHGREAPHPDRVWWPETDDEVLAVLEAAEAADVPVVVYGAGSGVCGGARGMPGSWVLDTKRFDAIGDVDPETWSVEVGAGVNGQVLEDALEAQGWTLGHSPSSIGCSTVGGWAAARSAGQFSSRYGVFEDMVLGLDAVAPGVGAFHLGIPGADSPAQRGPDGWLPLILGSEGTLAVVTRVRVRVRPLPEVRRFRAYKVADVPRALHAMRELMQAELWPSVVRLYDPVDTLIGGKTKPKKAHKAAPWWLEALKRVEGLPAIRRRTLVLPLSLPGQLQQIAEGLTDGCLLIVGWEGAPDVVAAAADAGEALLASFGEDLGTDPGERWFASRHAVSYKLMPIFERGGFADTMEIAAPWSRLHAVYEGVRAAVREHALVMAHMSHVYPEGGCIYFSFAGVGDRDTYDALWSAALDAVLANGATTTHHHGVGQLKAGHASREIGAAIAGWKAAKATLDPSGRLNPGRLFVDGQVADAPSPPPPMATDGLVWGPREGLAERLDRLWAWDDPAGPPPWARSPWQTGWIGVRGQVDGMGVALGRGPRSASGSDLRPWLAEHGDGVTMAVAIAADGPKAMRAVEVEHPWAVARDLLRADLRPARLGVVDGTLHVGFRGPAAAAFAAIAATKVPGLMPVPWREVVVAADATVPCAPDDPRACGATSEHVLRRPDAEDAHG